MTLIWKRSSPGRYHAIRYTIAKLHDGKWHVFDRNNSAEITLRGVDTLRGAKAVAEDHATGKVEA